MSRPLLPRRSSCGLVGLSYPYADNLSERTVSRTTTKTLGFRLVLDAGVDVGAGESPPNHAQANKDIQNDFIENTLTYPANVPTPWYTEPVGCPCEKVCVSKLHVGFNFLFGCSSKETGSDTGVPDALNDQDGGTTIPDADIDADDPDADVDVDGGPPEYADWALFGRVDYRSTNNEIVACDSAIDLTGAAYTGDCDGCDYAFAVTAEN